jgi:hypothetical protein
MARKYIGKMILDDSGLTGDRSLTMQDNDVKVGTADVTFASLLQNALKDSGFANFNFVSSIGTAPKFNCRSANADLAQYRITNNNYTILIVGKFPTTSEGANLYNIHRKADGNLYGWNIDVRSPGLVRFFSVDSANNFSTDSVTNVLDGKIHSIACLRHSNNGTNETIEIWVDGALDKTASATAHTYPTSTQHFINPNPLEFGLYRVMLFNRKLTQDEIKNYSVGSDVPWSDLDATMVVQTSGSLVLRQRYIIVDNSGGFSATGQGAPNNNVGTEFIAIGASPTWGTGSVRRIGCLYDILGKNSMLGTSGSSVYASTYGMRKLPNVMANPGFDEDSSTRTQVDTKLRSILRNAGSFILGAYAASNTAISANSITILPITASYGDADALASDQVTLPYDGLYEIDFRVHWVIGATAPTYVESYIEHQGNTAGRCYTSHLAANTQQQQVGKAVITANAGDVVQLRVYSSTQNVNIYGGQASQQCYMQIRRLPSG